MHDLSHCHLWTSLSLSFLFLSLFLSFSLYLSHLISFSLHILAAIEGLISKTNYVVWGCISLALFKEKNLNTSLLKKHYACFKNGSLITELLHIFTDLPIIQHSLSWTLGWMFHLTRSIMQNVNFSSDAWIVFTAAILAVSVIHMTVKCNSRAKQMILLVSCSSHDRMCSMKVLMKHFALPIKYFALTCMKKFLGLLKETSMFLEISCMQFRQVGYVIWIGCAFSAVTSSFIWHKDDTCSTNTFLSKLYMLNCFS